ncbi:Panacea domain-containing protein [Oenococcus oeni]|uniref:Panacea domain-containing protein n=1 Tax=Oenococcus oeni TaxID=1247 RepID=UPI0010B25C23|nr:type II toxin-antitoxin system antitoxin SocA domain-containing protein [Oenococcus oeni]SYW16184.1 putative GepA protein [Oenococcus oeni]
MKTYEFMALSKIGSRPFGWVSSSDKYSDIIGLRDKIENVLHSFENEYTFHIRSTSNSEQHFWQKDSYFQNVKILENMEDFVGMLKANSEINILDVASYFRSRYHDAGIFSLEKILYFVYADSLKHNNGLRLFKAKFEAWEHGPIDRSLYKAYEEKKSSIQNDTSIWVKNPESASQIVRQIEKTNSDYEMLFDRMKYDDDASNPTHRENTPWSITWKNGRGRNQVIQDETILNFHNNEL